MPRSLARFWAEHFCKASNLETFPFVFSWGHVPHKHSSFYVLKATEIYDRLYTDNIIALEQEWSSILYHKEYYFSASQFSLLVSNWLHKSQPLRVRNVAVSQSVIFTLIYQFIKIHWCTIGERKWHHKSDLQHNDPNQLGIAENVMMNYVLVLVPLYIVIVLLYGQDASSWHGLYLTKKSC